VSLFGVDNWLKTPADRDVIARWTVGADRGMRYALALPPPPDPDRFEFLVLGDTGDSEASGPRLSPQDAVAKHLAADASLPGSDGQACLVLHTGDVVYMTGERRLYDRNFRRPYAAFLTPQSTVDHLVFRLPFLPVPGNHDYYDLGGWGMALARVPFLGAGLRAIAHELFAFSLPEGGSGMGQAFMQAFVDLQADTREAPLPYRPGEQTRLPNRYYRFQVGAVDFFALDSNTLDAPPPEVNPSRVRSEAAELVKELEAKARVLDRQLRRDQLALERWQEEQRRKVAESTARLAALAPAVVAVRTALEALEQALQGIDCVAGTGADDAATTALRRWAETTEDLNAAGAVAERLGALQALEEASDEGCAALRAVESCLTQLPEGPQRADLLAARKALEEALQVWYDAHHAEPLPEPLCARIRKLSEEALDTQRELSRERRRMRYRPQDHDAAQIRWLEEGLAEAQRERPDGWRVVYLHHPVHSTIANHCERPDVQGVRENLLAALRNRVHLVLSGHSHAFEWFRSAALPGAGLFVTGGGGQVSLRRSLLDPRVLHRHRDRYDALRTAGVLECAVGGRGPAAEDGEDGPLYHYLRVEVTPEALVVSPIGVRRLGSGGYRREAPMPVHHAPELSDGRPPWQPRRLEAVEIPRGGPPRARWA
jgi:hypothetical protein